MNLGDIRTQFGNMSGRLDLVEVVDDVAGVDVYINAGSRMLDKMADIESSSAVVYKEVVVGDFYLELSQARSIFEVWLYADGKSYQLKEGTREQLRGYFPSLLTSSNRGIPAWYHTANMRLADLTSDAPVEGFLNHVDMSSEHYNGIIFPPINTSGIFEITGNFYSNTLENATDENYWSVNNPMMLLWAALYFMEVSYRNSEGAKDWLLAITQNLTMLEFDHVEQEMKNLRQIGGRADD